MRTGKILSFNKKAGIGLIEDENGERIKFFAESAESIPERGDVVSFEIAFNSRSLTAVNVATLVLS